MKEASIRLDPKEMGALAPADVFRPNAPGWQTLYGLWLEGGAYTAPHRVTGSLYAVGQAVRLRNTRSGVPDLYVLDPEQDGVLWQMTGPASLSFPGLRSPISSADWGDGRWLASDGGLIEVDDIAGTTTYHPDTFFGRVACLDGRLFCARPSAAWIVDWCLAVAGLVGDTAAGKPIETGQGTLVFYSGVEGYRGADRQWLLDPASLTKDIFQQRIEPGAAGFFVIPGARWVDSLVALEKALVIFADSGVWLMTMDGGMNAPTLQRIGLGVLDSLGAAAGCGTRVVWLGDDGGLWLYAAGQSWAQRLGYAAALQGRFHGAVQLSVERQHGDFWIGDGVTTFVLREDGSLSEIDQPVVNVVAADPLGLYGGAGPATGMFYLTSQPLDLGMSDGFKHMTWVGLAGCGYSNLQVRVDTRYTPGGDWIQGAWVSFNEAGSAYVGVSGYQFQLNIQGNHLGEGATVSDIVLRFQVDDKRATRGI